jgi:hypothetical protein
MVCFPDWNFASTLVGLDNVKGNGIVAFVVLDNTRKEERPVYFPTL